MRTFYTTTRDMLAEAKAAGADRYEEPTGFLENWGAATRQIFDSGWSISRDLAMGSPKWARNIQLQEYVRNGDIDVRDIPTRHSLTDDRIELPDYPALARLARSRGLVTQLDEEIEEKVRADVREREKKAADVYRRAAPMGVGGYWMGTFAMSAADPAMLPSYVFGIGAASKSATLISNMARVFAAGAAVEAGTQGFVEPFVYRWKNELGQEYSVKDAMMNIAFAASLGGGIPASAHGLGTFIKRLRLLQKFARSTGDPAADTAARVLDQTLREAEEGVKRSTPRVDAQGRNWDDVKYQIARQNAENAGLLDEFLDEGGNPPGSAEEFFSEVEGEVTRIEETRPTNGGRPTEVHDPAPDDELEAAFNNATKEDFEISVLDVDEDGQPVALTTRQAREVVDSMDDTIKATESLINCLKGSANVGK